MSFGQRVIDYHLGLKKPKGLPKGVSTLYPYEMEETLRVFKKFYKKYFSDCI